MNVGTVTTGAAGTNASASITDNGNNSFTLNMTIPRGNTGSQGPTGPAGTGAITAASLTTNGYVRFSNGLTIQWGVGQTGYTYFPINFTSGCYNVNLTSRGGTSLVLSVSSYAINYFISNSNTSSNVAHFWIAIGV